MIAKPEEKIIGLKTDRILLAGIPLIPKAYALINHLYRAETWIWDEHDISFVAIFPGCSVRTVVNQTMTLNTANAQVYDFLRKNPHKIPASFEGMETVFPSTQFVNYGAQHFEVYVPTLCIIKGRCVPELRSLSYSFDKIPAQVLLLS